jgi:hypothetical protein
MSIDEGMTKLHLIHIPLVISPAHAPAQLPTHVIIKLPQDMAVGIEGCTIHHIDKEINDINQHGRLS